VGKFLRKSKCKILNVKCKSAKLFGLALEFALALELRLRLSLRLKLSLRRFSKYQQN
jgi:hypothetical protein